MSQVESCFGLHGHFQSFRLSYSAQKPDLSNSEYLKQNVCVPFYHCMKLMSQRTFGILTCWGQMKVFWSHQIACLFERMCTNYQCAHTGDSRLMQISLLRFSLLWFFKTFQKYLAYAFFGLIISLLRFLCYKQNIEKTQ